MRIGEMIIYYTSFLYHWQLDKGPFSVGWTQ